MACRGRPPAQVLLDPEQRGELERRVRAATSTQRAALRARILLACAEQCSAEQVAHRCGVASRTVERWRSRFRRHGLPGLEDKPRSGPKPKFGHVTRLEILALACEPVRSPNGQVRRTIEQVCRDALVRGVVETISWSSVQRFLAQADLRPHLVRGWMHSPDPEFRERVTHISELYLDPPPGSVVLCVDEKSGMQAIERRFPDRLPAPGRRRRREFEYRRHGTQSLLASFEVHTGDVFASCGNRRTGKDLVHFMDELATRYPTGTVHIVWDNLNIHYDGVDRRWSQFNERHGDRFVFHYTPKHASWVNQIELFFSILQRQCLAHASFSSTQQLREIVLAYIDHWNRHQAHPFRWTFTGYPLQAGTPLQKAC